MYLNKVINFERYKGFLIILLFLSILLSCSTHKDKDETEEVKSIPAIKEAQIKAKENPKNAINNCLYNNEVSTLGLGLVMPPGKFNLFNDSLLADKYAEIDMYSGSSLVPPVCPL